MEIKNNEIIMASGNKGKIEEAKQILCDFKIISLKELGVEIEIEEDQTTSLKNAEKKAKETAQRLSGRVCLADDSEIQIEYLNGFPGVKTKRWFDGSDRQRNLAILEKLEGVPRKQRKIKFISAVALSDGNKTVSAWGEIGGFVAESVRGDNGFGFDEIFELENGKTLAELSKEEKNEISARKMALEKL